MGGCIILPGVDRAEGATHRTAVQQSVEEEAERQYCARNSVLRNSSGRRT